ncbi:DNA-directed RNA polymerase subunit omega [Acetivibrio cellulolyticus]|uniref:DNA-directed RNA polymerase subunit omega n=1 Tax=Acetivibrio cellulolyticus TaxID=35830 RepID=UPI0001E2D8B1
MIEPSISSLMEKVDSRYTLCILVGKRARQLTDGARSLTESSSSKVVTTAANEVNENMITYVRTKSGIK